MTAFKINNVSILPFNIKVNGNAVCLKEREAHSLITEYGFTLLRPRITNVRKAHTCDSEGKTKTGVSFKAQNHYKRAPRTRCEHISGFMQ